MPTTCVACKIRGSGMIEIYAHPNGLDQMFTLVTSVEVLQQDFLCILCYDELKSAHNFRQKCIQNNIVRLKNQALPDDPVPDDALKPEKDQEITTTSQDEEDILNESFIQIKGVEEQQGTDKQEEPDADFEDEEEILIVVRKESVEVEKENYKCEVCGKEYLQVADLKEHLLSHIVPASVSDEVLEIEQVKVKRNSIFGKLHDLMCEYCFKEFQDYDLKFAHEAEHKNEEKPYTCYNGNCKAKFKDRVGLRNHVRIHSDVKRFKCCYCDMRFHQRGNQVSHERQHTGEKPFLCPHCGKGFAESGNLKNHVRAHTGERPYFCSYCPKKFKTHYSHKVHIRSHTNERPYKCTEISCNKAFFSSGKLSVHKRIHTGDKPYQCVKCPAKFVDSSGLKRHSKIH